MRSINPIIILLAAFLLLESTRAQDEAQAGAVFGNFLAALKENAELSSERKEAAMEAIAKAQADDASLTVAMALGIQALYPEFDAAISKANQGDGIDGLQALYKLARSKDRFLAAEAAYVMARTLFSQQRYEECLPFLQRLQGDLADKTLRRGDVLYYAGVSTANSLHKKEAIALLAQYLEEYPDASDRLRLSAQATLDGITGVLDGSVEDIADHMDFSHRRLSFEDSGEQTQEVQGRIVTMLERIIQEAEEQQRQQQQQQQQQQAGGSGQSGQQQQQQQGAGEGQNAGGNANAQNDPKSLRNLRGAAKSEWDDLRKRERESDALGGLKSKYPPRYRELVEQYFKDLQQGEEEEGDSEEAQPPIEP